MPAGRSVTSTKPVTARSLGLNTRHPARVQRYSPFSSTRSPDHSNTFMASVTEVLCMIVVVPCIYRSTPASQCSVRSRAWLGATPYVPPYPSSMHAAWIWNRRQERSVLIQRDCSSSWGSGTIPRSSAIALNASTDMVVSIQRHQQNLNRIDRSEPSAKRLCVLRILCRIRPNGQLILQPNVCATKPFGCGTQ